MRPDAPAGWSWSDQFDDTDNDSGLDLWHDPRGVRPTTYPARRWWGRISLRKRLRQPLPAAFEWGLAPRREAAAWSWLTCTWMTTSTVVINNSRAPALSAPRRRQPPGGPALGGLAQLVRDRFTARAQHRRRHLLARNPGWRRLRAQRPAARPLRLPPRPAPEVAARGVVGALVGQTQRTPWPGLHSEWYVQRRRAA